MSEETKTETVKPKRGRPPKARAEYAEVPYQDPISVHLVMTRGDGVEDLVFRCVDYDTTGQVWRFKSFPRERGRQIVRLISAMEVVSCTIDEPEGRAPAAVVMPTTVPPYVTWTNMNQPQPSGGTFGVAPFPQTTVSTGPQSYVAKDHLANRAEGGMIHGVPQSFAKDENGNETRIGAAMIPLGAIS